MNDLVSRLQQQMHVRQIPGASIRVAQNGNILFKRDLGVSDLLTKEPLNPQHLFKIGCLTKPIVAHGILHLGEQHELDINHSIFNYIPELNKRTHFHSIKVRHLLSHTAGLARGPYHSQACSDQDHLHQISQSELLFSPGEHFKYSNWGYYLLGKIIENITGGAPEAFISNTIFTPLEMHHSSFFDSTTESKKHLATGYWKGWYFGAPDLKEPSAPCPHIPLPNCAAGMITNADDYLHWLIGLASEGKDEKSLQTKTFKNMLASQHEINQNHSVCYGFFVEIIDGIPFNFFVGNNSGFSGFSFMITDLDLTGVVLCNHDTCSNELREMLYQVCREMFDCNDLPHFGRQGRQLDIRAAKRKEAVNLKTSNGNNMELVRKNQKIELYPHAENTYFLLNGDDHQYLLRIKHLNEGDTILTLGNTVFYENLNRLRMYLKTSERWNELTGMYCCSGFGKVEVICREGQVYLHYGVMYETLLEHIEEISFKQKSGAFCYETIEFQRDKRTGEIALFLLNDMIFLRQSKPQTANP